LEASERHESRRLGGEARRGGLGTRGGSEILGSAHIVGVTRAERERRGFLPPAGPRPRACL